MEQAETLAARASRRQDVLCRYRGQGAPPLWDRPTRPALVRAREKARALRRARRAAAPTSTEREIGVAAAAPPSSPARSAPTFPPASPVPRVAERAVAPERRPRPPLMPYGLLLLAGFLAALLPGLRQVGDGPDTTAPAPQDDAARPPPSALSAAPVATAVADAPPSVPALGSARMTPFSAVETADEPSEPMESDATADPTRGEDPAAERSRARRRALDASLDGGEVDALALLDSLDGWFAEDPSGARERLEGLASSADPRLPRVELAALWLEVDRESAAAYLASRPFDETLGQQLQAALSAILSDEGPEAALRWAATVADVATRLRLMDDAIAYWLDADPASLALYAGSGKADPTVQARLDTWGPDIGLSMAAGAPEIR